MAVRQTKKGLWLADVTLGKKLDGSRDRRQIECRTKKAAEKEEQRLLLLKDKNRGKSYGSILFGDFVEMFFWPQKQSLRPTTVKGYKRDLKLRLMPAFENVAIDQIDRYAIQKMISACPTKKVATNAKETLSSILGLAREMEVIEVNPAGFRNYSYPDQPRRDPTSMGEWITSFNKIYRLLDWVHEQASDTPEERMCVLGLLFGMRKGEVLGLDAEGISLRKRYIEVYQSYTQGIDGPELTDPKTPRAFRKIPMSPTAYEYVSSWDLKEGPVVLGSAGKRMAPMTGRDRIAALVTDKTYQDGSSVPRITQFSMRHSFGTSCAEAGVEITKLRDWMGHVDTSVTREYYIKHTDADLQNDADMMDELFGKRV